MHLLVKPIDVLVSKYVSGLDAIVRGDLATLAIDPLALAVYPELKNLQQRARVMGYDLDLETARQAEAHSDANSDPDLD